MVRFHDVQPFDSSWSIRAGKPVVEECFDGCGFRARLRDEANETGANVANTYERCISILAQPSIASIEVM